MAYVQPIAVDSGLAPAPCCPLCCTPAAQDEAIIKRGALTVAFDPVTIWWRGIALPLSRVESQLFAFIIRRGRVSLGELDLALEQMGASPATRPVVLGHIRRKVLSVGASNPIERLGKDVIRLVVDADETGSRQTLIGLTQPRFARATGAEAGR
jgi:hypothetical protein